MRGGNKVIGLSVMLSAANIVGSSGLMVWIDHSIRQNKFYLSAYSPLVLYLSGLSVGCCAIGWLSYKNIDNATTLIKSRKIFFLLLCGALFAVCLSLAAGDSAAVEWLDGVLRFFWGLLSGFAVILARTMLVLPDQGYRSQTNFSILSLALACLPVMIPVSLSLGGFYQRTASAIVAAGLYFMCMVIVKSMDFDLQRLSVAPQGGVFKYSTLLDVANLITLNVCFFLLLMLVPMINEYGFPGRDISSMYAGFLLLWVLMGVACIRVGPSYSKAVRFKVGVWVQCCMLLCCVLLLFYQVSGLFFAVVALAFLANMLMQPVLFLSLGSDVKYRTLLFGFQSGLYIFMVCGLLLGVVYFELGMQYVFGIFCCLALLSLLFSCVSIVITNRFNTN